MPKDASKNVDRYKVRGGSLNEYDFEKEKATDKRQMNTGKTPQKKAGAKKSTKKNSAT